MRPVSTVLGVLALCLCGWLCLAPISALVPKRRDWVAVLGRQGGSFLDNVKYFLLQASALEPEMAIVFVTEDEGVRASIAAEGFSALRYPGIRAIWFLMRCGSVVVDESAWFRRMRYFLTIRAKVIQLWHGIPFKQIELRHWQNEAGSLAWASRRPILALRLMFYRLTGRWTRYAAVVATSTFFRDQAFAKSFRANSFPTTGYPRNDFALSLEGCARTLAWSNVDARVAASLSEWQRLGRKLVLVAPTFRDSGTAPMRLDDDALRAIDAFAEEHGVEFLFKFHPAERNADRVSGAHFHVCARNSDIYPLMPCLAALVTDYSSIGMDFLLVDKPLLFLIPENDDYASNDRQLQFDPRSMMPGPVVPDWRSLLSALLSEWQQDRHAGERAALRSKAFDDLPQSEAVPKLLAFMREQGWIADPAHPHKH